MSEHNLPRTVQPNNQETMRLGNAVVRRTAAAMQIGRLIHQP